MATQYTSLLGLALPVTGELSGSWGDTVNDAITSLLDEAVAGTTSITVDADITLTTTVGLANQSRQAIILWNPASGTTTRNITAPAQSKIYTVINASGGTQSIVFRGVGPTTGVTIVKGESAVVAWNGTDFIKVSNTSGAGTFTNLTVTGNTILGDASGDTITVNGTTTFANVNPTLTAGTVNGVAYLNGSKVLTTGSALTFDGTNLGVGVASPTVRLQTFTSGVSTQAFFESGTGASVIRFKDSTTTDTFAPQFGSVGNSLFWQLAGSEQMRLTSTGLGIGTSSPAYKLDVRGTGSQTVAVRTQTSGDPIVYLEAGGTNAGFVQYSRSAQALQLSGQNPTVHATLDSSGNLGLGVTPSAWASGTKAFDVGSGSALFNPGSSTLTWLMSNSFNNGTNFIYKNTGAAGYYSVGAAHSWHTAPSGTAGNAISFTQAMTLTAGGNLLVGTTTDAGRLTASGTIRTLGGNIELDSGQITTNSSANPLRLGVDGTERSRIDSSGNFMVGATSNNGARAYVNGIVAAASGYRWDGSSAGARGTVTTASSLYAISGDGTTYGYGVSTNNSGGLDIMANQGGQDIRFWCGTSNASPSERMRIDSSGNLLVGTTSGSGRATITAGSTQNGLAVIVPTVDYFGAVIHNQATSGTNCFIAFGTEASFSTRGTITYNRGAGLTAYNTTSDYRAKDIIGPVVDSGALIDSVPVYMGKMKGATQERPMFIAHETPDYAHTGEKDAVDADGNPVYQQMDASALIPVMWAEIQSLRARLAAANI